MTTDDRILVLMPTVKDGDRTRSALIKAGLTCTICADLPELCREIAQGAAVALLTEEAVVGDRTGCLQEALLDQPPWSNLPLVVLAGEGAEERRRQIRESMNATLVERPVKLRSLLSVLRAALRSRQHQYAIRDYLAERDRVRRKSSASPPSPNANGGSTRRPCRTPPTSTMSSTCAGGSSM